MTGRRTRSSAKTSLVKVEAAAPLSSSENLEIPGTSKKSKRKLANKRKKDDAAEQSALVTVKKEKIEDESVTKRVKFTGAVPVDEECIQCVKDYHVHVCGDTGYNAMLNQTNVSENNNKYYLLQLLKHNHKPDYYVWFRWGRVGKIAGTNLQSLPYERAVEVFEKKFSDKTKNLWEMRKSFTKFPMKYDLLQMDYGKENSHEEKKINKTPEIKSKLDKSIQEVMTMLFDIKEFEESVKEMHYDVKKAPLGKLTERQIKSGYVSLKKIESYMQKGNFGKSMAEACGEFYTRIPHDFGMKRPPLIRTPLEMKGKLQLLEALGDIQVAITILHKSEEDKTKNPLDIHYQSLQCEMTPLKKNSKDYKIIQKYVTNTHAPTHSSYKLSIEDVFKLSKPEQDQNFSKDLSNRMLLWHGSRLTNWCGILQQGLRIAPLEAPSTGYMFGKGIYFADMVSKSANYCFATERQPVAFLLLCEVALGCMNEKLAADSDANELPAGKHSTKGLGKTVPDPESATTLKDGTIVPTGVPVPQESAKNSALLYNEYVVYNVNQVRPRFLVKVKFMFEREW